jgi:hypothetical protein
MTVPVRYYEIACTNHRLLNPFSDEKLMTLGRVCRLRLGQTHLDLASGKGEMLCRWAQEFGIHGLGVEINESVLTAARLRAAQLRVSDRVSFVHGDALTYVPETQFDIVSCLGATWLGGGLTGTIDLMRPALKDDGLLLVGEPYWIGTPPPEAYAARKCEPDEYASLEGTLDRFAKAGLNLVELVLADHDDWERFTAGQWWAITEWLRADPGHPDSPGLREFLDDTRRAYLAYLRDRLGWGVFVLRPA